MKNYYFAWINIDFMQLKMIQIMLLTALGYSN